MTSKRKTSKKKSSKKLPKPYSLDLENKIPPGNTTVRQLVEMCLPSFEKGADIHEGASKNTHVSSAKVVLNDFAEFCRIPIFAYPRHKIHALVSEKKSIPVFKPLSETATETLRLKFFKLLDHWLSLSETDEYKRKELRTAVIEAVWHQIVKTISADIYQSVADLINFLPFCKKHFCVAWAQDFVTNNIDAYDIKLSEWKPGDHLSCSGGVVNRLYTCLPAGFGVFHKEDHIKRIQNLLSAWLQQFTGSDTMESYYDKSEPTQEDKEEVTNLYKKFLQKKLKDNGETENEEWKTAIDAHLDDEYGGIKGFYGGRRTRKIRRVSQIKMATAKYDKLFLKLSKSLHDTEYAHMIEDKLFWLFVSDIANGNLKQDEIFQIANKINKVIIEDRKNAGRWFA
jgi:hypothetical protein